MAIRTNHVDVGSDAYVLVGTGKMDVIAGAEAMQIIITDTGDAQPAANDVRHIVFGTGQKYHSVVQVPDGQDAWVLALSGTSHVKTYA